MQGLELGLGQHVPDVAEVGHAEAAAGDDADKVVAAPGALDIVVPAEERFHRVVRLPAGDGDLVFGVVVVVAVAAQHKVRREAVRQLQPAGEAVGVWVEHYAAGGGLDFEAGVAVPGYFHADTSSKRFYISISQRGAAFKRHWPLTAAAGDGIIIPSGHAAPHKGETIKEV